MDKGEKKKKKKKQSGFAGHRVSDEGVEYTTNFHAWAVDDKGCIYDYKPTVLASTSLKGTTSVRYHKWPEDWIKKMKPTLNFIWNDYIVSNSHMNISDLMTLVEHEVFPPKHCYQRARILHKSNRCKYTIKIGSFGFIQHDETIFWKFG